MWFRVFLPKKTNYLKNALKPHFFPYEKCVFLCEKKIALCVLLVIAYKNKFCQHDYVLRPEINREE